MYFAPGVTNPYNRPMPAKKRGRKTNLAKYLEKQTDLFPADLYLAKLQVTHPILAAARLAADSAARSVASTAAAAACPPVLTGGESTQQGENEG
jgi:hypothetical protein